MPVEQPMNDDAARPDPGDDAAAATSSGSGRRGLLVIALALVVGVGILGALVTLEGDGAAPLTIVCEPSPGAGEVGVAGLDVPEGPKSLAPGQLCAFDDDSAVDVASFLGAEPLVINFWASWCEPCRAEMPDFQAIHEASEGKFRLIGVNHQDAPALAREFAADLGITYDMVRDPSGRYLPANGGFGMPTTLFVQPDGSIEFTQTGPIDAAMFSELLAEHFDVEVTVDGG